METSMKKLALFVVIVAIAMFIVVGMASAAGHHFATQRQYIFTATGSCLIAIRGFNASLQPSDGATGLWFTGPVAYDEGVLTFNKDGTGSVTAIVRVHTLYSSGLGAPPDAGAGNASFDFTYTVTGSNITFTYVKGSFELDWTDGPNAPPSPNSKSYTSISEPWSGMLSPDGKTIYAWQGVPSIIDVTSDKANMNLTGVQEICNLFIQGFRSK